MNYYNENDSVVADWLRQLIAMGAVPEGEVDTRSIEDVTPNDLKLYKQCHFFAGIGGWAYALQLAGVPSDYPVWTGSCPCQPFSAAGKRTGTADERHLWPAFHWLIQQCRPGVVFGEQVASPDGVQWWDGVATDLEGIAYTCAAFDLPAAGIGAPHTRSRLFWVAHTSQQRPQRWPVLRECANKRTTGKDGVDDGTMGNPQSPRPEASSQQWGKHCLTRATNSPTTSGWDALEWLPCSDGKIRPTQSGIFPLANGIPQDLVCCGDSLPQTEQSQEARVVRLKGYGNAIVPQLAAEFIRAAFH